MHSDLVVPILGNCPSVNTISLKNVINTPLYDIQFKIVPSQVEPSCKYKRSLVIFFIRQALYVDREDGDLFSSLVHDACSEDLLPFGNPVVTIPIVPSIWNKLIEIVCHNIVSHEIHFNTEHKLSASVHHIKPSPKNKDWITEYKNDKDLSLLYNHFSIKDTPVVPEIINNVDRCYKMNLR